MATEVKLPELAEGVETGEIVDIFAKEGDAIEVDTPLIEVNADKATLAVPSPVKGTLTKLLVKKGDKIAVGAAFAVIESGDAVPAPAPAAPAESGTPAKASAGKPAAPATPAPDAGKPPEDHHLNVGSTDDPKPNALPVPAPAAIDHGALIPAGPTVRRIAREMGIDLRTVNGSGRGGRITLDDLDPHIAAYLARKGGTGAGGAGGGYSVALPELPDFSKFGPVRREKADATRRKIAERMAQNWATVPHVHAFADADVTELEALRGRQKDRVKAAGGSLTFTVFAMKAVALALKEFPKFNSSWDPRAGETVLKDYIHIGVAVDTPGGLLVPVVRDVDKKTLVQLATELPALAAKTRDKKVGLDDLRGGTFTISNLGGIGGGVFTPIINAPEVAILGIGRTDRRPVFDKSGAVVGRDIAPLCLGYDHRVIDGADGARFLARLTDILENFEAAFLGF